VESIQALPSASELVCRRWLRRQKHPLPPHHKRCLAVPRRHTALKRCEQPCYSRLPGWGRSGSAGSEWLTRAEPWLPRYAELPWTYRLQTYRHYLSYYWRNEC